MLKGACTVYACACFRVTPRLCFFLSSLDLIFKFHKRPLITALQSVRASSLDEPESKILLSIIIPAKRRVPVTLSTHTKTSPNKFTRRGTTRHREQYAKPIISGLFRVRANFYVSCLNALNTNLVCCYCIKYY